jgi:hypothetical protein
VAAESTEPEPAIETERVPEAEAETEPEPEPADGSIHSATTRRPHVDVSIP